MTASLPSRPIRAHAKPTLVGTGAPDCRDAHTRLSLLATGHGVVVVDNGSNSSLEVLPRPREWGGHTPVLESVYAGGTTQGPLRGGASRLDQGPQGLHGNPMPRFSKLEVGKLAQMRVVGGECNSPDRTGLRIQPFRSGA